MRLTTLEFGRAMVNAAGESAVSARLDLVVPLSDERKRTNDLSQKDQGCRSMKQYILQISAHQRCPDFLAVRTLQCAVRRIHKHEGEHLNRFAETHVVRQDTASFLAFLPFLQPGETLCLVWPERASETVDRFLFQKAAEN